MEEKIELRWNRYVVNMTSHFPVSEIGQYKVQVKKSKLYMGGIAVSHTHSNNCSNIYCSFCNRVVHMLDSFVVYAQLGGQCTSG